MVFPHGPDQSGHRHSAHPFRKTIFLLDRREPSGHIHTGPSSLFLSQGCLAPVPLRQFWTGPRVSTPHFLCQGTCFPYKKESDADILMKYSPGIRSAISYQKVSGKVCHWIRITFHEERLFDSKECGVSGCSSHLPDGLKAPPENA